VSPPESSDAFSAPAALVAALRSLFRPLVRLLIDNGITYPFLAELLKSTYVEAAAEEFPLEHKRLTTSRLSLLTGIHRREARRLLDAARSPEAADARPPRSVTLGSALVARWTSEPAYLDAKREPRALPRADAGDGEASFEQLVASVSRDIHPRSVLDEWLRLGVAELDAEDRVRLRAAAFLPRHGFDEKAYYLGRSVRDHISAAATNLMADEPPFIERSVSYGSLPAGALPALAALSTRLGAAAIDAVNAAARDAKQGTGGGERRRMTFGVYFYEEPVASEPEGERRD
jgi:hypothetical protein